MKKATRKTLRVATEITVLILLPYIFLYLFVNERGKEIFINTLRKRYNIEARVNSLSFNFPLSISLVNFRMDNIGCMEAVVDLGFVNPLTRTFTISKLHIKGLDIELDKKTLGLDYIEEREEEIKKEEIINEPQPIPSNVSLQSMASGPSVKINTIILDDSSLIFKDDTQKPSLRAGIEDVSGTIKNFTYPKLGKLFLDIKGTLRVNRKRNKDVLSITGWVDWPGKDMSMVLKAKEVDYFIFKDYYPPFWKPKNLELKEARLSLKSRFVSEDDDLLIDYYIILSKTVFSDTPEDESKVKSLKTIIALLKRNGLPTLHLKHRTKMSSPTFKVTFIGEGLLERLKEIDESQPSDSIGEFINITGDAVEGGVKGLKGLTIDPIVEGVWGFGEELLKNIKKIMRVEDKEEEIKESNTTNSE